MRLAGPSSLSRRAVRLLDGLIVVWVAAWAVLGLLVGREVRDLAELSETVAASGRAIETTGRLIDRFGEIPVFGRDLRDVPLIGGELEDVVDETLATAGEVQRSASTSRESVERLSLLLAVAIGGVPSLPLLALYLPMRIARVREVRALRADLRRRPDDQALDAFLARRAADRLPFDRLREISETPWRDIAEGRHRPLADAELARLGIRRP